MRFPRLRFLQLAAGCLLLMAPPVWAQTPADAVFVVTALDVAPGQAAGGIAVLKPYRDAARKQAGNLGAEVLQESGWANRFMIYETWRDRASYEANEKAAALSTLRDKLKPIAPAPIDRRDYKTVSVGAAKTAAGAVLMLAHCDVVPPFLDKTLAALKEIAEAARKSEGNLRFDVVQTVGEPRSHTTLIGAWQSRKAFDEFQGTNEARRFRDTLGPFLGSPLDDRLYALID
jgi:quinol monooxygenase YgiN